MIKWIKYFVEQTFDAKGRFSAPQLTGFLMCIFGCVLTGMHSSLSSIIAIFSAGLPLLGISGTAEVIRANNSGNKKKAVK